MLRSGAQKRGRALERMVPCVVLAVGPLPPYIHLVFTWHHSCDERSQAFPVFRRSSALVHYYERKRKLKMGRPGNEATLPPKQHCSCRHFCQCKSMDTWCAVLSQRTLSSTPDNLTRSYNSEIGCTCLKDVTHMQLKPCTYPGWKQIKVVQHYPRKHLQE